MEERRSRSTMLSLLLMLLLAQTLLIGVQAATCQECLSEADHLYCPITGFCDRSESRDSQFFSWACGDPAEYIVDSKSCVDRRPLRLVPSQQLLSVDLSAERRFFALFDLPKDPSTMFETGLVQLYAGAQFRAYTVTEVTTPMLSFDKDFTISNRADRQQLAFVTDPDAPYSIKFSARRRDLPMLVEIALDGPTSLTIVYSFATRGAPAEWPTLGYLFILLPALLMLVIASALLLFRMRHIDHLNSSLFAIMDSDWPRLPPLVQLDLSEEKAQATIDGKEDVPLAVEIHEEMVALYKVVLFPSSPGKRNSISIAVCAVKS